MSPVDTGLVDSSTQPGWYESSRHWTCGQLNTIRMVLVQSMKDLSTVQHNQDGMSTVDKGLVDSSTQLEWYESNRYMTCRQFNTTRMVRVQAILDLWTVKHNQDVMSTVDTGHVDSSTQPGWYESRRYWTCRQFNTTRMVRVQSIQDLSAAQHNHDGKSPVDTELVDSSTQPGWYDSGRYRTCRSSTQRGWYESSRYRT